MPPPSRQPPWPRCCSLSSMTSRWSGGKAARSFGSQLAGRCRAARSFARSRRVGALARPDKCLNSSARVAQPAEEPRPPMRRQPFDFDISVTADKKRRARGRGFSGAVESSERGCERPGCDRPGKYRAPKSPDNLDDFHWFCLDHVREYNLKWNFFESYSDDDLERQFAADRVWGRPTRPFGEAAGPAAHAGACRGSGLAALRLRRSRASFLGDKATLNPGADRAGGAPASPAAADRAAGARDPRGAGQPDQDRDPRGSTRRWSRICIPT